MRLTVIACLTALASAGPAYAGGPTAAQCEAATAAMPEATTGVANTFYSTGAPGPISPKLSRIENPHQNWHGRTPKPATLAALQRVLNTSALSCSSAQEVAAQRGTILSDDEGQRRLKAMGLNGITAYFHRVSLSALNPQGQEAIVAIVSSSNQLAGGVMLVFLAKTGPRWEIVGQNVLIVG